ncbi:tubby-like protein 4 [Selaginella moellendorffii]|uniref:tubby-like protein 4 n=1 Tax=Selaginella moellendorffii TaxID=88036 RepID=UPI000D1CC22C|nr:tubby-like protein 4 [Selaginella moellendorffii]|eukprot:XP_024532708.1 tubby-like protein 4 [Selaginella moellendorffii]
MSSSGSSKLKKSSSHQSFKSFLNPLGGSLDKEKSSKSSGGHGVLIDCGGGGGSALPMHLCHSSSVQCDVIDVLKENAFRSSSSPALRKSRSQRHHSFDSIVSKSEPLCELNRGPLSASKKHNRSNNAGDVSSSDKNKSGELSGETPLFCATPNHRLYVWDEEAAPASAWSTLGNRVLLLKPLPVDVGKCRCYIVREHRDGPSVYSLYTDEGQGRQDRLLAVARHRRRVGRSEFLIAQSTIGTVLQSQDEGYLGNLGANLVGSRYQLWEQGDFLSARQKVLQGVVTFEPTVTTLTGDSRKLKAFIPKYQSIQTNGSSIQFNFGLGKDWEENMSNVKELVSKTPCYNNILKRYELDFRESSKMGAKIKTSVKNFQLTVEDQGKQAVLLLGKLSKSTYVMEYRFPLTGFQAFGICLASIDSKLCCTV